MSRRARLLLPAVAWVLMAAPVGASTFQSAPSNERPRPPWSSLTSPTAALRVVLDQVCLPAIMDDRPIGPLAEDNYLRPVEPRSTGSPQAVAAWRLASWHNIFVMQLPNGGCSLSLEAGDADDLAAQVETSLAARDVFTPGQSLPTSDGNAVNTAWCSPEPDRPVVAGIVKRVRGRRVALLVNLFRAQGATPPFCTPGT